ncbi:MmcQ/YjbR family DNA-binding protein [Fulvivirgaceae bacterium PWU5]|uniref:MmcQ/YjbR family DNA-binding protein n=1 Tax=Dawidia cretensis TaxID=2782350 RepID=A0AAP2E1S5_9BACT|nr:MmcQ/YjbR family DNA-binding protein [Dawidia cretensis]MBT1710072.1 MmcQ/YjbR family DNA-binding protein [Dawidia cretensis]
MDLEHFMRWCNAKKGVTEEFPFGENILVYKVMGKMFALTDVDQFESVNLKVDPEQGVLLQEEYAAVQPGYHMNKKHWITVVMDGSVPNRLLQQWVDNSYNLVVSGLTKKQQIALNKA